MKKRNTKTALCAAIRRPREPEKKPISIVRPAQINLPCPTECQKISYFQELQKLSV
jgi:hypothetical protein